MQKIKKFILGYKKDIKEWVFTIGPAILLALFITNFIIANVNIPTGSMEPTIMSKSRMFGNRLAYISDDPKRGDIVIFKYPDDESLLFVKRIIGEPGDKVEIKGENGIGSVYINGEKLDEPYIREQMIVMEDMTFEVPEGSYFMMGDNRNQSNDGRFWNNHFVKENKIIAKAGLIYFPEVRIAK